MERLIRLCAAYEAVAEYGPDPDIAPWQIIIGELFMFPYDNDPGASDVDNVKAVIAGTKPIAALDTKDREDAERLLWEDFSVPLYVRELPAPFEGYYPSTYVSRDRKLLDFAEAARFFRGPAKWAVLGAMFGYSKKSVVDFLHRRGTNWEELEGQLGPSLFNQLMN
jgi:hypothetical protein